MFEIEHVRRNKNTIADALSKLASTMFASLKKKVMVETLKERAIAEKEVLEEEEEGGSWMKPIVEYITQWTLPTDPQEARKVRVNASLYTIKNEVLYRRSYLNLWQRCVGPRQARNIIQEIHRGSCGLHAGPRTVVTQIRTLGYFWPTMHQDTDDEIIKCNACQIHSPVTRVPKHNYQ